MFFKNYSQDFFPVTKLKTMEFTNICNACLLKAAGSGNFLVLIKTPNYLESHTKSETKALTYCNWNCNEFTKKKFKKKVVH